MDGEKVAPLDRALRIDETVFRHLLVLHEGEMPEPDGGEIEEVPVEPAAAPTNADEPTVATASAAAEQDGEDGDLDEAPTADDEEGDL
jgi:hypothetical protein